MKLKFGQSTVTGVLAFLCAVSFSQTFPCGSSLPFCSSEPVNKDTYWIDSLSSGYDAQRSSENDGYSCSFLYWDLHALDNFGFIVGTKREKLHNIDSESLITRSVPPSSPDVINIWIDYNHDAEFDDADEWVGHSITPVNDSEDAYVVSFIVPEHAIPGEALMRIVLGGAPVASSHTVSIGINRPCGLYSAGETEDYVIYIVNPFKPHEGSSWNRISWGGFGAGAAPNQTVCD